ncbi:MAG: hypothetical protein ACTSVU_02625 [Promethearchaeota archaeon]
MRYFWPLLLSHHPSCPRYKNHTLNFGKIHLCIGCFIGYPSAAISVLIGNFFIYPAFSQKIWLLLIGIILILSQFLSLTKFTEIKCIKIFQKFMMGFGMGLILIVCYYWFQGPTIFRVIGTWGIIMTIMAPIGWFHYRNMRNTCENCPDRGNPDFCMLAKNF